MILHRPTKKNVCGARKSTLLRTERLEDRRMLATFGIPWADPRNLAVSFPSDSAAIGHYDNSLREKLDQVSDRKEWQEAALRAFQTWAVQANINIGLTPDRGDDFGTVGLTSGDPRFGEFRIGAFPQGSVLANAAPFQPSAGTWAGDVLLNTEVNYFHGDWESGSPIDVPNANELGAPVELFSVLLHEAGNALGLADNRVAGAVMNATYSGPNGELKASDIRAIQALYGARQDVFESSNNNSRGRATVIQNPPGYRGAEPLVVQGSLNTMGDVDFYRFTPLPNQEKVNVRLFAAGVSLVKAKLEVFDRFGNLIGDVKADSIFENNLELEVGSLNDPQNRTLFVKVSRNTDDVFAIGDYRLELDYRPYDQQPSIIPGSYDADADGDGDGDGDDDDDEVDVLFARAGILDPELGANDSLGSATRLDTTAGFLANSRFEVISSISGPTDRDIWKLRTPEFASPLLIINLDPVGLETPTLEAVVLNAGGDRLATEVVRKPDGGVTLTVSNPQPSRNLYVFVRNLEGSVVRAGNYVMTANFATNPSDSATNVARQTVSSGQNFDSRLNVLRTQLFMFDLEALSSSADTAVQLSIYNERTGDRVATLASRSGSSKKSYIWLSEGSYIVRATYLSRTSASGAASFALRMDSLSDDQGPRPIDPTLPPLPDFDFEPGPIWGLPPVIDLKEPPFEDPWTSDALDEFFRDYYDLVLA